MAASPHAGFFQPSDQEIIVSFLRPTIFSGLTVCEFIHDADVYAADPAVLTEEFPPAAASNDEKVWYFFTCVRPKNVNGRARRKTRTLVSGEGRWHPEATPKAVLDGEGRRLGHRQSFSFKDKDGDRSGWLMVEFGLDQEKDDTSPTMVVCKVYMSPRGHSAETSAAASSGGRKRKAAVEHTKARAPVWPRPFLPAVAAALRAERADPLEEDDTRSCSLEPFEKALLADESDVPQVAGKRFSWVKLLTDPFLPSPPSMYMTMEHAWIQDGLDLSKPR